MASTKVALDRPKAIPKAIPTCRPQRKQAGNIPAVTVCCMVTGLVTKNVSVLVPVWRARLLLRWQNKSHVKFASPKLAMLIIFQKFLMKMNPQLQKLVNYMDFMKLQLFLMMFFLACPLTKLCLQPPLQESIRLWHLPPRCRPWQMTNTWWGHLAPHATGLVLDLNGLMATR